MEGPGAVGMMVYDALKAVDYLSPARTSTRQATRYSGHVDGQLDRAVGRRARSRLKVVVDICCLTDWHTLVEVDGLKGHGIYYYVPDLLNHFTTAQMNALIAPRAHLSLAGQPGQAHAARRPRKGRCGTEEGLRLRRPSRELEAAPLRRRTPGEPADARRDPQVVRGEALMPAARRRGHSIRFRTGSTA